MGVSPVLLAVILLLGIPLGILLLVYLVVPTAKGIAWLVTHVFRFIFAELGDVLRLLGSIITAILFVPLTLANVIIGRWSGASHYGRAIEAEGKAALACLYRLVVGNPARLLMLSPLTEGIEQRVPNAVANAPGADRPNKRAGQFDGYTIVGSLPGGGSGSRLYVATPSPEKAAGFARAGAPGVDKVVIKSFSLLDGSSLPQIVRENRALPAAKRLGLILEHELTDDRFYYVTRYVPGEPLGVVASRLHAIAGGAGLSGVQLSEAIDYAADLMRTLSHYHTSGLWHKDVKPDNIIVADGRATLVDFGLVTPLRSSITLTTHGTEYFRDPEMVRMALRGVKVHEVDGARFDIYAAGAVLYSMLENSFPAHGGLSRISKKCPEALRWIVRRAMADYDKRYQSAAEMLADLQAVGAFADPFAFRPADLPSVRHGGEGAAQFASGGPDLDEVGASSLGGMRPLAAAAAVVGVGAAAGAGRAFTPAPPALSGTPSRPTLRLTSWWTGRYSVDTPSHSAPERAGMNVAAASPAPRSGPAGRTAAEQLASARLRAGAARSRAQARLQRHRKDFPAGVNAGVVAALLIFLACGALIAYSVVAPRFMNGLLGRAVNDAVISTNELDGVEIKINGVPVAEYVADATIAPEPPKVPDAPRAKKSRSKSSVTTVTNGPMIVGPVPPKAKVFVLRDPVTFESDKSALVDAQITALSAAGFWLEGNSSATPPADSAQLSRQETQLAELKTEIGIESFGSDSASRAARRWLENQPDLTTLIWFGRADDGQPGAHILTRAGQPATLAGTIAGVVQKAAQAHTRSQPQPASR